MWCIKYKNGDILHFNPNHDPSNGQFSEGKGVDSKVAINKKNIKFGDGNEFTIPKNVVDKVATAFNKGPNSAVVKTILDDQKKGFFDPNLTETDIKKALRNKPDEITLNSYIRSDNGKKGISGVATYYGYNKDGSENADHKKVFGDHLVEVEFDAQTGKIYFVSLQG